MAAPWIDPVERASMAWQCATDAHPEPKAFVDKETWMLIVAGVARQAAEAEREACAVAVESITMGDVLLAAGEMSAQERRTVKALLPWLAGRIRNRNLRK